MTPADLARQNAIAFECKKDGLRQTQAGTWKVTFTVLDMDERLTRAFPGTRYQAVLVEIGDSELPVHQPAKETLKAPATPQPTTHPPAAAKREKMDWRELQPAAQAGIRCADPVFRAFLREGHGADCDTKEQAALGIKQMCGVQSRSELGTNHKARVLWHQLDEQFLAWRLVVE